MIFKHKHEIPTQQLVMKVSKMIISFEWNLKLKKKN